MKEVAHSSTEIEPEPLLVSPQVAAQMLSIARSTVYELMAIGAIPSIKIGTARRIPTAALHAFIEQYQSYS